MNKDRFGRTANVSVWDQFKQRGFFQQVTEGDEPIDSLSGPLTGYIGFDPTADSCHAGHLIPLMSLLHFQRAGHRPIALLGGGTAMIGDPTGKNDMRKMLETDTLDTNLAGMKSQIERLFAENGMAENPPLVVNNADWLRSMNYIDFMREVGVHFSVNRLLTFETFKTRMETGLSFLEFNYPLLQGYDFLELYRRYDCRIQMGGDDQWANILSGVDLVRRAERKQVYGWTYPLLTTASGAKMGKTEKGALWLDPTKTSPYEFYQYWVNVDDRDVSRVLGTLTLLPMEEVQALSALEGAEIRQAKQKLAYEVTRIVHGEEEAKRAEAGARALFGGGGDMSQVPSTDLPASRFAEGVFLPELMVEVGLAKSRGEARRLIQQGGVSVNDAKVDDAERSLTTADLDDSKLMLKVGKKRFHQVVAV